MLKNKNINTILLLSILLFSIKWVVSFYFYDESLSVRLIFDSGRDGEQYFPLIKYFASFELNKSFDPSVENLKIMPFPITAILIHSTLFKIFGNLGFLIVEFLAIFSFLIIFYKIFSYFFSKNESILLSLLFFSIPSIISILNIESLPYINLLKSEFYTLRIPRPIISGLYLFSFLYLIVSMDKGEIFTKKKSILLGIILGFSLSSVYHFFFIEISSFLIFLVYKFKSNILKKIIENYKNILLSIFFFLLSILPFLLILLYHEEDLSGRAGVFQLNFEKKKILLEHYLSGYIKIEFLIFFLISTFLVYLSNKQKITRYKIINIFFILFLGSMFAPIIFIVFSNKASVLYHFNNAVFVWASLMFAVYFITILKYLLKIELNLFVCRIFCVLIALLYCFNIFLEQEKKYNIKIYQQQRIEFQKITEIINNNVSINKASVMTFNIDLMIWAIMNDVKYLSLISAFSSSKTDDMIENDLIKSFKFLQLNAQDFKYFLRNKKEQRWRYLNNNVATFFLYRYQANSVKTYNNSKNFDPEVAKFILSSSPLYTQQSAIPNEEFLRLEKKFHDTEIKKHNNPDVIILENSMSLSKNAIIKKKNYCKLHNGTIFVLYLRKNYKIKCD